MPYTQALELISVYFFDFRGFRATANGRYGKQTVNFVAFNKYLYPGKIDGLFFTIFIITIAAAEAAVAISIIINLYRTHKSIDVDDAAEMKH